MAALSPYGIPGAIDPSLAGSYGSTPYNAQGQWNFGAPNAEAHIRAGPRSHAGSSPVGGYAPDVSDVISNASAKALEASGHFLHIKVIGEQRATEIARLQEIVASQTKEINDQKVEIKTLRSTMKDFAKDYHDNRHVIRCGAGVGSRIALEVLPPKQALRIKTDNPAVVCWTKRDFGRAAKKQSQGETDGEATSVKTKRKPGRPPRESDDEEDHSSHFYLENQDGTPVDKSEVAEMSRKARTIWRTLDKDRLAPTTFGKMIGPAMEYFLRNMLADKAHEFLLLCDDGEWKLREWSTRSYPSWYRNKNKPPKSEKPAEETTEKTEDEEKVEGSCKQVLDDPDLLQIGPDEDHDEDDPLIEDDLRENPTGDDDDDGEDNLDTDEQPPEDGSVDPGADGSTTSRGSDGIVPPEDLVAGTQASATVTIADPFAKTPSSTLTSVTPPTATVGLTQNPNTPSSATPLTTPDHPPTSASSAGIIPRATTGLRLKLKLGAPTLPPTTLTPDTTLAISDASHLHKDSPQTENLRLQRAQDDSTKKKRPHSGTAPTTTSKRQKVSDVVARPTEGNTLKNICMRRWNERQASGQGLLSDFDIYFKSLTDTEKEPFMKELRSAQAVTRKATLAAKKAKDIVHNTT